MALTRNNIAYKLEESPYLLDVPYEGYSLIYFFSSALYRDNFYKRFVENREKINASLSNRFGVKVENDALGDLVLYSKIEKRGFLIGLGKEKATCQESIILNGAKVMIKP